MNTLYGLYHVQDPVTIWVLLWISLQPSGSMGKMSQLH